MTDFLSTSISVPVVTCITWCLVSYAIGYIGCALQDYIMSKISMKKESKTHE